MISIFGGDIRLNYLQSLAAKFSDSENGVYSCDGMVMDYPDSRYLEELYNYKTLIMLESISDTLGHNMLTVIHHEAGIANDIVAVHHGKYCLGYCYYGGHHHYVRASDGGYHHYVRASD